MAVCWGSVRGPETFFGQGEIYVKLLPDGVHREE